MKSRSNRLQIVAAITILFVALVVTDIFPLVRGPVGWRWAINDTGLPWWPTLLTAIIFLFVWYWLSSRLVTTKKRPLSIKIALIILFLATLGLQVAMLTRFHPNPAAILYERLASDQASGYFSAAQEIKHLPTFLREYAERMPTFRADPHPRSKPPGIVLLYWGWEQILLRLPLIADPLGGWARGIICNNLWLARLSNAALASNVVMAILTPIFSALAIFPAYGLAHNLWGKYQGWIAAGLTAIMPGRLIFAPHMDTVYPLLALFALYLVNIGLNRQKISCGFLSGLAIGVATFMSLVNGLIAIVIGLYVVARCLPERNWRTIFQQGLTIMLGTFGLWIAYWILFDVTMWDIYQAAAPARHDLERSYSLWLVVNIYDYAIFAGLPTFLLGLPHLGDRQQNKRTMALLVAFWVTLFLFDLSGTIRGEVGRIWLMLAPFPALLAVRWHRSEHAPHLPTIIFAPALLATVIMGGRWQTTEVEWPIVPVQYESAQIPSDAVRNQATLSDTGITLAAYEVKIDDQLHLTLFWENADRLPLPYTVFVHLVDADQVIVAQQDIMPQNGTLPTTCWLPKTLIADEHTLNTDSLLPGDYTLWAGLYDQTTNTRLGDPVELTTVTLP